MIRLNVLTFDALHIDNYLTEDEAEPKWPVVLHKELYNGHIALLVSLFFIIRYLKYCYSFWTEVMEGRKVSTWKEAKRSMRVKENGTDGIVTSELKVSKGTLARAMHCTFETRVHSGRERIGFMVSSVLTFPFLLSSVPVNLKPMWGTWRSRSLSGGWSAHRPFSD